MFQPFPVCATSCRRRRGRPRMGTIRINRAAAARPLGHDEPRFLACLAAQRSRVSLGDGSSVCERRGSLSARGYLPVFSSPALLISAEERRSAKKRLPQRSSRTQRCLRKPAVAARVACARCNSMLSHAVSPDHARCRHHHGSGRMHHPTETTPPTRFPTSRVPSTSLAACKTLAKQAHE